MKYLFIFATVLLLLSCTTTAPQNNWHCELPTKQFFIDYYQQDQAHQQVLSESDYLNWIKRFYLGWQLYSRGWLQTSEDFAATLATAAEKQWAAEKMATIGQLIAPEWAKNDAYRVINTRHLSIWGNALNHSIVKSTQVAMINAIEADIQALLSRRIEPNAISSYRYYQDAPFEQSYLSID